MQTYKLETITPEQALKYLQDHNRWNRPLSEKNAKRLATSIKLLGPDSEFWHPQSLSFYEPDAKGIDDICDGQHRLLAITIVGFPVTMLVVRGVPRKTLFGGKKIDPFYLIDEVKPRDAAALMAKEGIKNASRIVPIARSLANWIVGPEHWLSITKAQVDLSARLLESELEWACQIPREGKPKPKAQFMAPIVFYRTVKKMKAEEFATAFLTMEKVSSRHPAFALDNYRQSLRQKRSDGMAICDVTAQALNAWDQHGDEKKLAKLTPSIFSRNWLLDLNKPLAEAIRKIVRP